jgi:hypothetical protein
MSVVEISNNRTKSLFKFFIAELSEIDHEVYGHS